MLLEEKDKMKNIFKLLLFYLLGKPININLYGTITKYCISEIQTLSGLENPEKIIIVLTSQDAYKIDESLYNNIKS